MINLANTCPIVSQSIGFIDRIVPEKRYRLNHRKNRGGHASTRHPRNRLLRRADRSCRRRGLPRRRALRRPHARRLHLRHGGRHERRAASARGLQAVQSRHLHPAAEVHRACHQARGHAGGALRQRRLRAHERGGAHGHGRLHGRHRRGDRWPSRAPREKRHGRLALRCLPGGHGLPGC